MRRHRLDPLALAIGLAFAVVVVLVAIGHAPLLVTPGVLPATLVVLATIGLVSGWLSRRRSAAAERDDQLTLGERAAAGRRERGDQ